MQALIATVERVAAETGEGGQQKTTTRGGDEFKRLKSQLAANIKEIRGNLKQRDELLAKGASGTKATVQMSHSIRQQLKLAREDANRLMTLQRKEAAKTRGKAPAVEQAENRQEVVELVFKHIEECELQEKKRFACAHVHEHVCRRAWMHPGNPLPPSHPRLLRLAALRPRAPKRAQSSSLVAVEGRLAW